MRAVLTLNRMLMRSVVMLRRPSSGNHLRAKPRRCHHPEVSRRAPKHARRGKPLSREREYQQYDDEIFKANWHIKSIDQIRVEKFSPACYPPGLASKV